MTPAKVEKQEAAKMIVGQIHRRCVRALLLIVVAPRSDIAMAHSKTNCHIYQFLASQFMFVHDNAEGDTVGDCYEGLGDVPRCPGQRLTISATIIDQDSQQQGSYNIVDTFMMTTDSYQFVRIGHGSFTLEGGDIDNAEVSSLFIQTHQKCFITDEGEANIVKCRTNIGITGGTGVFECATGTIDMIATHMDEEILYSAEVCFKC